MLEGLIRTSLGRIRAIREWSSGIPGMFFRPGDALSFLHMFFH